MDDTHASSIKAVIDQSSGFIHFRDGDGNVIAEIIQTDQGDSILRHATGETLCDFHAMSDGSQLITGADGQQYGLLSSDVFGDSVFHDLADGHSHIIDAHFETADGSLGVMHDDAGSHIGNFQVHDMGQSTIIDMNFDNSDFGNSDLL